METSQVPDLRRLTLNAEQVHELCWQFELRLELNSIPILSLLFVEQEVQL